MARFNLDDYVQVNDRISKFWEKFPDGAITTEEVFVDNFTVRYKAAVYANRGDALPVGTGHAEETRILEADIKNNPKLANNPNAGSAVENCETSAVGRALAMAGFEVSKSVASRQEMEKVQRQQEVRESRSRNGVDKASEPAKVEANGAEPDRLTEEEARTMAGSIKKTGMETSAIGLKLNVMGIEKKTSLAQTLQTMTHEQAQDLYSWVVGETSKEN